MTLPFGMQPGITLSIIAANVIFWLVFQGNQRLLHRMLFINRAVVKDREYDRLLASGFAHHSIIHLAFNMLTLYYFGPTVELLYGGLGFISIYLLSIVGGNLFCLLTHREDPGYSALGASGGLFGIVYAFVWILPQAKLSLFLIPVWIPGWIFAILVSGISILLTQLPRGHEGGISHEGHLGGALTGGLMAILLHIPDQLSSMQQWFLLGGIAPIMLLGLIKWVKPGWVYRHRRRL